MGETRVDLLHLLEDLRDAYPGALEETIVTEIVANALDSGAGEIEVAVDPVAATLTVVDDGSGMQRRDLARYHDVAATSKTRGQGIGFAGVGIKLGLLACEEVLTETRRGKTHVASSWRLASRHRAPWRWVPPPGIVGVRGTAVRLRVQNPLSPLVDPGFVESALRRQFDPLLDPALGALLAQHYPRGVRIVVNGRPLTCSRDDQVETAPLEIRFGRKRKPSAIGYLERAPVALPEDRQGVAISTFGKVIKRGWDWLGVTATAPDRISGLVEAPALAECLTLNKADFIRTGPRGALYLAYRKAIQEAVSRQLAAWGDARDTSEEARQRAARPVERDLERVVTDLSDDFPLLSALVDHRPGKQRRLAFGRGGTGVDAHTRAAIAVAEQDEEATAVEPAAQAAAEPSSLPPEHTTGPPSETGTQRATRSTLSVRFEEQAGDPELARLIESTVWVNVSHPAYRRAVASRSDGYHIALAAALALARLAVEPAQEHAFVTAFLARWGETAGERGTRRR